ncbi:hypothetical protein GGX14DRAFT_385735 [Mycena pura]|uniref:Uncharacterized protein n=1 Tax=Mycena pura TaxID=153505 RepID=A0AAD6YR93_9AGAR|nr:hypothetical protein GGX14DRAFT_385735 [Mycena pura]
MSGSWDREAWGKEWCARGMRDSLSRDVGVMPPSREHEEHEVKANFWIRKTGGAVRGPEVVRVRLRCMEHGRKESSSTVHPVAWTHATTKPEGMAPAARGWTLTTRQRLTRACIVPDQVLVVNHDEGAARWDGVQPGVEYEVAAAAAAAGEQVLERPSCIPCDVGTLRCRRGTVRRGQCIRVQHVCVYSSFASTTQFLRCSEERTGGMVVDAAVGEDNVRIVLAAHGATLNEPKTPHTTCRPQPPTLAATQPKKISWSDLLPVRDITSESIEIFDDRAAIRVTNGTSPAEAVKGWKTKFRRIRNCSVMVLLPRDCSWQSIRDFLLRAMKISLMEFAQEPNRRRRGVGGGALADVEKARRDKKLMDGDSPGKGSIRGTVLRRPPHH